MLLLLSMPFGLPARLRCSRERSSRRNLIRSSSISRETLVIRWTGCRVETSFEIQSRTKRRDPNRLRLSSSCGPAKQNSLRRRVPTLAISSAAWKTLAAAGLNSAHVCPMPTVCAPCPGQRKTKPLLIALIDYFLLA